MKSEIEQLIELYRNKDTYKQDVNDLLTQAPVPEIAEALNLQDKHQFGKNRQRAELLKQNEVFLAELSVIKERLGKGFLELADQEIPEPGTRNPDEFSRGPSKFFGIGRDIILKSDFAQPVIILSRLVTDDLGQHHVVLYLPGTPILNDDWPEREVEEGEGPRPLNWVVLDDEDPICRLMGTPMFEEMCKEKVFDQYSTAWGRFLARWHISLNWDGDLRFLHVHSLPSVLVELDRRSHVLPVVIRLGAWATREDVGEAWGLVEEKMKEARVYRERESENFLRDQIWYKQKNDLGMTPLQIAREWAKRFPKEIDLEVIEKLARDEETFVDVPPQDVLEEVLCDDKLAEFKGRFIESRKAYISSGLRDRVKKSVQATQKKIGRLGSDEWDRNRERLLKPTRKQPEK